MRKKFDAHKESFSTFSASLVAGDTAILADVSAVDNWLGVISELLRRGIVVHTPAQGQLDVQLHKDMDAIEALARLGAAMDRKARIEVAQSAVKSRWAKVKKSQQSVAAKAHQLIEEQGVGLVEACRKVHCCPSDYYIYRSKLKARNYVR